MNKVLQSIRGDIDDGDTDSFVCFACEVIIHGPPLLVPTHRDAQGRALAFASVCLHCGGDLVEAGEVASNELRMGPTLSGGLVAVPVVGELRGDRPITVGLCVVCEQPAELIRSALVETPGFQFWVHDACRVRVVPSGQGRLA